MPGTNAFAGHRFEIREEVHESYPTGFLRDPCPYRYRWTRTYLVDGSPVAPEAFAVEYRRHGGESPPPVAIVRIRSKST